MNEPREVWGEYYRLVRGKGYGQANWWVLTKDGRTEVAGGLLYAEAKRIFDQSERNMWSPGQVRASLNPTIIDLEDQQRKEMRDRNAQRRVIID